MLILTPVTGAGMLVVVTLVYLQNQTLGFGGAALCFFGVVLVGMWKWKTMGLSFGLKGVEVKFETEIMARVLNDDNEEFRHRVAGVLAESGPVAVDLLIVLLKDESAKVRSKSAWALGRIDPQAKDAIKPLVAALNDDSDTVRLESAKALGRIGPQAKDAIKPLRRAARKDNNGEVRSTAQTALTRIDS